MNRRTIHPIAPWLIAGLLLISGGIVFRVWAQQATVLAPASPRSGAVGDDGSGGAPGAIPRLGSKIVEQPAAGDPGAASPDDNEPVQPPKLAASPQLAAGAASHSVDASTGVTAGRSAAPTRPEPTRPDTPTAVPAPLDDDVLFALLLAALDGASRSVAAESDLASTGESTPTPAAGPRLLKADQLLQVVTVEWTLDEMMTPLLTEAAAQRDVTAILATLREANSGYRLIHLVGFAPRLNPAAPPDSPPRLEPVLWLTYDAATVERIDWSAHPRRIARTIFDYAEHARGEGIFSR